MSNSYDSSNIEYLTDIDHIRLRPSMYIGELNDPRHLFVEAIDNSIDEVLSGYCNKIIVKVDKINDLYEYSVEDYGRGIPIGTKIDPSNSSNQVSTLEVITRYAKSGGKFDNDSYKIRCFTGDTKVRLADNRNLSFEDLYKEYLSGKINYVYSMSNDNTPVIDKISKVAITGKVNKLLKITLDNGETIKCTNDHLFMLRDGSYKKAEDLTKSDSLMPGYLKYSKVSEGNYLDNYLMIYSPNINDYEYCHHLADDYNIRNNIIERTNPKITRGYVRHHVDFDKHNNNPDNLLRVLWQDHYRKYHKFDTRGLVKYNKSEKGRKKSREIGLTIGVKNLKEYVYSDRNRKDKSIRMTKMNTGEVKSRQREWQHTEKGKKIMSENRSRLNKDPEMIKRIALGSSKDTLRYLYEHNLEINEENYTKNRKKKSRTWKALTETCSMNEIVNFTKNYNHKIISIEEILLDEEIPVYDLKVSNNNPNFLLSSGVFVHNCGLHGIGTCAIASLSSHSEFSTQRVNDKGESIYNTVEYYQDDLTDFIIDEKDCNEHSYTKKVASTTYMNFYDDSDVGYDHVGTKVTFTPDDSIFKISKIPIDFIINKCKICNAQYGNVIHLIVEDKEVDVTAEFTDLIYRPEENTSKYVEHLFEVGQLGNSAKIFIEYNSGQKYSMKSYCNLVETYDGGTHYKELIKSIEKVWSEFLSVESEVKFHKDDCRLGLYGVISISISDPQFSSQTKEKLTVDVEYLKPIFDDFENKFRQWLVDNEDLRHALIKRFEIYRNEKDKMSVTKDIMKLVKINDMSKNTTNTVKRKSVVPKLVECSQTKRDNTEVYFVEGDSAGGVASRARNSKLQAVLPLRGKIKNVTNMDIKSALKSQEVLSIVNTAGCGVGDDCNPNNSRYDRYIINADGDSDGAHISSLVLSVFINILPELVKQGYVYLALPPLYGFYHKSKYCYTDSLEDIPEELRKTKSFTRFKGLGEMDDDQYEETCMNPDTRKIVQVTYPDDLEKFNRILGSSIGRRELLSELGLLVNITNNEDSKE